MKRHLLKTAPVLLLPWVMCLPYQGAAQCQCDDGTPATPVEHIYVLDTTTSSATTISFPRFDPSIGTLNCITLHDTVTIVSTLGIRNLDPSDKTYRFRLTVNTTVTGPTLYRDNFVDVPYGPDLLTAFGTAGDSISYGPDTVFDKVTALTTNITDFGAYMGAGNVTLNYEIGGGVTSLAGGINFNSSVRTRTWGVFKLTYYWCPTLILASNIKSFSAIRSNNRINLAWAVQNEEAGTVYELQVSRNGKTYTTVRRFTAAPGSEGNGAYQHEYLPEHAASGKIYFRIKQISETGKITYSVVRFVDFSARGGQGIVLYPNPVKDQVSVQFGKALSGTYKVEVVSLAGQVVYRNLFRMHNSNSLLFDLPATPAGIYYLRASNTTGNETFTHKLMVQH